MTEVVVTDDFAEWFEGLDQAGSEDVAEAIDYLEIMGVRLGYPRSSDIKGASFPLRELRVQATGRPLRVFYAFDPKRQAVILMGGDKTGEKRFYEAMVARCERLWQEYLDETAQVG